MVQQSWVHQGSRHLYVNSQWEGTVWQERDPWVETNERARNNRFRLPGQLLCHIPGNLRSRAGCSGCRDRRADGGHSWEKNFMLSKTGRWERSVAETIGDLLLVPENISGLTSRWFLNTRG